MTYKHPVDCYKSAVAKASAATVEKYSVVGPYELGTKCHEFWLSEFNFHFGMEIISSK